ncbi:hypothetical protein HK105_200708 [Polyrhizophydium stewartii]|uniref:Uncharacterized protein n=1 Tax=Polyrhizophydium stewartii TaxID=2732419 RepID=A0ABR4NJS4_9FUNG
MTTQHAIPVPTAGRRIVARHSSLVDLRAAAAARISSSAMEAAGPSSLTQQQQSQPVQVPAAESRPTEAKKHAPQSHRRVRSSLNLASRLPKPASDPQTPRQTPSALHAQDTHTVSRPPSFGVIVERPERPAAADEPSRLPLQLQQQQQQQPKSAATVRKFRVVEKRVLASSASSSGSVPTAAAAAAPSPPDWALPPPAPASQAQISFVQDEKLSFGGMLGAPAPSKPQLAAASSSGPAALRQMNLLDGLAPRTRGGFAEQDSIPELVLRADRILAASAMTADAAHQPRPDASGSTSTAEAPKSRSSVTAAMPRPAAASAAEAILAADPEIVLANIRRRHGLDAPAASQRPLADAIVSPTSSKLVPRWTPRDRELTALPPVAVQRLAHAKPLVDADARRSHSTSSVVHDAAQTQAARQQHRSAPPTAEWAWGRPGGNAADPTRDSAPDTTPPRATSAQPDSSVSSVFGSLSFSSTSRNASMLLQAPKSTTKTVMLSVSQRSSPSPSTSPTRRVGQSPDPASPLRELFLSSTPDLSLRFSDAEMASSDEIGVAGVDRDLGKAGYGAKNQAKAPGRRIDRPDLRVAEHSILNEMSFAASEQSTEIAELPLAHAPSRAFEPPVSRAAVAATQHHQPSSSSATEQKMQPVAVAALGSALAIVSSSAVSASPDHRTRSPELTLGQLATDSQPSNATDAACGVPDVQDITPGDAAGISTPVVPDSPDAGRRTLTLPLSAVPGTPLRRAASVTPEPRRVTPAAMRDAGTDPHAVAAALAAAETQTTPPRTPPAPERHSVAIGTDDLGRVELAETVVQAVRSVYDAAVQTDDKAADMIAEVVPLRVAMVDAGTDPIVWEDDDGAGASPTARDDTRKALLEAANPVAALIASTEDDPIVRDLRQRIRLLEAELA